MRTTPSPLPTLITEYRHPPYKNIYEICEHETFVFGTESLFGDWDAELFILAQDPGPAEEFEQLRNSGHPPAPSPIVNGDGAIRITIQLLAEGARALTRLSIVWQSTWSVQSYMAVH